MGNCVSCRSCVCTRLPKVKGEDHDIGLPLKASLTMIPRDLPSADVEATRDTSDAKPPVSESKAAEANSEPVEEDTTSDAKSPLPESKADDSEPVKEAAKNEAEEPAAQPDDAKSGTESEDDAETLAIKETSPYDAAGTAAAIQAAAAEEVPKDALQRLIDDELDARHDDQLDGKLETVAPLEEFVASVSIETPMKRGEIVTPFAIAEEGESESEVDMPMDGIEGTPLELDLDSLTCGFRGEREQ